VIGPSGSQVLELAVFNGQGGEPPTVLRCQWRAAGRCGRCATAGGRSADAIPTSGCCNRNRRSPPASSVPSAAAAAPPANTNGPSEAQMQAIRERIQARRRQLQQQQQQQPSPPPGDGTNR
jgi:general secretion pathway protein N